MPIRLSRSLALLTALVLTAFALFSPSRAIVHAQGQLSKPNIVLILIDDLDVGLLKTLEQAGAIPHIKANFIDRGINFSNTYVTNSSCCPSRATFLTGQYSHNHRVLTNHEGSNGGVTAFDDSNTLAMWLQAQSYRTGLVGKYLNGYGYADVTGDGQVTEANRAYVPPGWTDWQALVGSSTYLMYDYHVNDNGIDVRHLTSVNDYQTDVLAKRAVDFIQESDQAGDDTPFFLMVTPVAPHLEGQWWNIFTTPFYWDIRPAPRHAGSLPLPLPRPLSFNESNFTDKPAWIQQYRPRLTSWDINGITRLYQHRLEAMRAVDDLVGRVFESLSTTGELANTVVILTSDNGFLYGEHRQPEKYVAYEESIKVPLYVRMPAGIAATRDAVILNNDMAPTIAMMAGATPGLTVDGTSFVPLLSQQTPPANWRQRFLVEHWQSLPYLSRDVPTYAAVRTRDAANLLYVQYDDPAQTAEFYDHSFDAAQVWSQHAATSAFRQQQQQALRDWIAALRVCQGSACQALEFQK